MTDTTDSDNEHQASQEALPEGEYKVLTDMDEAVKLVQRIFNDQGLKHFIGGIYAHEIGMFVAICRKQEGKKYDNEHTKQIAREMGEVLINEANQWTAHYGKSVDVSQIVRPLE